jgi:hypothetical protein
MISFLVFAATYFSSTVAATMLLILLDIQKHVFPYYTHTHTHAHTAVNSLTYLLCYLFLVPKMSFNF